MFRNVCRLLMIGAVSAVLSACLPDSDLGQESSRDVQTRSAKATGLARSLSVAATQAADAFIRDNSAALSTMNTRTVNVNALAGVSLGPAANVVGAGFCEDNRSFIVWLTPRDNQGRFSPTALGEGSTGSVMSKLTEISDPTSIGVAMNGNIQMSDGNNIALSPDCTTQFRIPIGAPVMVFANLQSPDVMATATTRTETRTRACPAGTTGTITERRIWNVDAQGVESLNQDWNTVADMCSAQVATVPVPDMTGPAVGSIDLLGAGGTSMLGGIADEDLRNMLADLSEEECVRRVASNGGGNASQDYNTCDGTVGEITPIADLQMVLVREYWDYMTGPVSTNGMPQPFPLTVSNIPGTDGATLNGMVTASAWNADRRPDTDPSWGNVMEVRYRRTMKDWQVRNPDGSEQIVTLRGLWEGDPDELAASRDERIAFGMGAFAPNWSTLGVDINNLSVITDNPNSSAATREADERLFGATYSRLVTVRGFAPPSAANGYSKVSPNTPVAGEWTQAQLTGVWMERVAERYECANGVDGLMYRYRTHTLTGFRTVRTSAWSVTGYQCRGVCGNSNGQHITGAPSGTDMCLLNYGNASVRESTATDGTVTYSWTCFGTAANPPYLSAGQDASCSATKASTVDGVCGSSHGNSRYFSDAPNSNLCTQGEPSAVTAGNQDYTWACQGTGEPKGKTATCRANRVTYQWQTSSWGDCSATCGAGTKTRSVVCMGSNGQSGSDAQCGNPKPSGSEACMMTECPPGAYCGTANGVARSTAPGAGLCQKGSSSSVDNYNGEWRWLCSEGTSVVSCRAPIEGQTSCGCAHDTTVDSAPAASDLCNSGTASGITTNSNTYSWTCAAGSQTVNCAARRDGAWCTETTETDHPACPNGQTGNITRTRTLNQGNQCGNHGQWNVTENTCRPAETYEWRVGAWDNCSASCGGGIQSRGVWCYTGSGVHTGNDDVSGPCGYNKPEWQQACNTQACAPTCPQATETDHPACPPNQSGSITRTRTVNQGNQCGNHSGWTETQNTCNWTCSQSSESETVACPNGYNGSMTRTRTLNQGNVCGNHSGWSENTSTCTPKPLWTCTWAVVYAWDNTGKIYTNQVSNRRMDCIRRDGMKVNFGLRNVVPDRLFKWMDQDQLERSSSVYATDTATCQLVPDLSSCTTPTEDRASSWNVPAGAVSGNVTSRHCGSEKNRSIAVPYWNTGYPYYGNCS